MKSHLVMDIPLENKMGKAGSRISFLMENYR
jgi:hypothetical protein